MAVVTIVDFLDAMDGDVSNGLFLKMFSTSTADLTKFQFIGANGKKSNVVSG